jgi:hypothetical protein
MSEQEGAANVEDDEWYRAWGLRLEHLLRNEMAERGAESFASSYNPSYTADPCGIYWVLRALTSHLLRRRAREFGKMLLGALRAGERLSRSEMSDYTLYSRDELFTGGVLEYLVAETERSSSG